MGAIAQRVQTFSDLSLAVGRRRAVSYALKFVCGLVYPKWKLEVQSDIHAHLERFQKAKSKGDYARHLVVITSIAGDRRMGDLKKIPLIAIKVTGGVGDMIIVARFLRDFVATVEPITFHIYAKNLEAANWVFGGVPGYTTVHPEYLFDQFIDEYDAAFWACQFVVLYAEKAKWEVLRHHKKLSEKIGFILQSRSSIEHFVTNHPYQDNFLARKVVFSNANRNTWLHKQAKIPYSGDNLELPIQKSVAADFDLPSEPYLTVHNGFDTEFPIKGSVATKCYLDYSKVIELVKKEIPSLQVVQLGTLTSTPIKQADVNLLGKTTLEQAAAIISGAIGHLDNEGGLVHIAAALGIKSCVIFGPTPSDFFGYASNVNIDPVFCGGCWWIERTWMEKCPRQFDSARCMTTQPPERVARSVLSELLPPIANLTRKDRSPVLSRKG